MTSGDSGVDMMRLEMLLREHFARTDKQLSEMRADNAEFRAQMLKEQSELRADVAGMKADIAEFQKQMIKEQREFETRIEAKFDAFEAKQDARFEALESKQDARFEALESKQDARFEAVNARFDALTTAVVELQIDMEGLKHDVQGLYHWDYWLISIILAIIVMPNVVTALKSLASGGAGLISGVLSLFRQKEK